MPDYVTALLRSPLDPLVAFAEPRERIFWLFWLSSAGLALWASRKLGATGALRRLADPQVWWHRSARADYRLLFVKAILRAALLSPFIVSSAVLAALVSALLILTLGEHEAWPWSGWALAAYSVVAFVAEDFARYWLHRAMHRVPVLWELHKVHHSAEVLTPITLFRTHPIEGFLNTSVSAVSIGIVTGLFFYLFGPGLDAWQILGVDALGFSFSFAGANLRHSHIWWSWGSRLERYFISPAQHQLHHSRAPEHHDKNYGVFLAVWDRMAGTLLLGGAARELRFGLPERSLNHDQRVVSMLVDPLRAAWRVSRRRPAPREGAPRLDTESR